MFLWKVLQACILMRIGTDTLFRKRNWSLRKMQVPRRFLLSPHEVGDMSRLQHDETEIILFHGKYYHDSVSIFDYLILNNDNSINFKNCGLFACGLGQLIAGVREKPKKKKTLTKFTLNVYFHFLVLGLIGWTLSPYLLYRVYNEGYHFWILSITIRHYVNSNLNCFSIYSFFWPSHWSGEPLHCWLALHTMEREPLMRLYPGWWLKKQVVPNSGELSWHPYPAIWTLGGTEMAGHLTAAKNSNFMVMICLIKPLAVRYWITDLVSSK